MKENKFCLIAITGDVAHDGMSDTSELIPFANQHFDIVENFLNAQTAFHVNAYKSVLDENLDHFSSNHLQKLFNNLSTCKSALFDAAIFTNKYQARTIWDIVINEPDEIKSANVPYKLEKNELKTFYNKIATDKNFAVLHIAERFGIDLNKKNINQFAVYGKYLFFKCKEKFIYNTASNKLLIFVISLNNHFSEIENEYNSRGFKWQQLRNYVYNLSH